VKTKLLLSAIKSIEILPLHIIHKLSWVLGYILYKLPTRESKVSKKNLRLVFPKLNKKEINHLTKKSLIESSKSYLEGPKLWQMSPKDIELSVTAHNSECLTDNDSSFILISPHLGSWEIINLWVSQKYQINSMYKPQKNIALEKYIKSAREKSGAKLYPADVRGIISLNKALKNKQVVGILPDQDPGKNGGVYVPFFGILDNTSTLVPKLAKKNNTPVIVAYSIRTKTKFDIYFEKVNSNVFNDDIHIACGTINQALENAILKKPEQYMWSYKRFRKQQTDVGARND